MNGRFLFANIYFLYKMLIIFRIVRSIRQRIKKFYFIISLSKRLLRSFSEKVESICRCNVREYNISRDRNAIHCNLIAEVYQWYAATTNGRRFWNTRQFSSTNFLFLRLDEFTIRQTNIVRKIHKRIDIYIHISYRLSRVLHFLLIKNNSSKIPTDQI